MKKFKITFSYITEAHQRIQFEACINALSITDALLAAKSDVKKFYKSRFIKIESCFCLRSDNSFMTLYNIFPVI